MAASNHTNLQASGPQGQQLSVQHTSTDSPILPAANLQQLQQIDPALVQWVVNQTEIEASHRRRENARVNTFVFIERVSGVVAGAGVAVLGFLVGAYLVMNGHEWAGVALCGSTLATIVAVLVTKQSASKPEAADSTSKPKRPAKK